MKYKMSFKSIAIGLVSLMLLLSFGLVFVYAQPDCDDTNSAVHPGATEVPMNGIDDDCNPLTLDSPPETDDDGDGYSENQGDCDDTNPAVNPGVTEVPNNGIDDDCDPLTLDITTDTDGDGIDDSVDNCVDVANADQRDTNAGEDDNTAVAGEQHYGNVCDPDFNNDGAVGLPDFNTWRTYFRQSVPPAPDNVDTDGNGVIGLEDFNTWRSYFRFAPGPGIGD